MAHILIVDDDASIARGYTRLLTAHNHEVGVCSSAEAALALCAHGRAFDLIISDLHMAGMSGLDMFVQLRQQPATVGIPAILQTSDDSLDVLQKCAELGVRFHKKATPGLPEVAAELLLLVPK